MQGTYTCFPPRMLGLDVVSNLMTFYHLQNQASPESPILKKEVSCTLQKRLLLCLLQTLLPYIFPLNIVSQSIKPKFMEEVKGALPRSFYVVKS